MEFVQELRSWAKRLRAQHRPRAVMAFVSTDRTAYEPRRACTLVGDMPEPPLCPGRLDPASEAHYSGNGGPLQAL